MNSNNDADRTDMKTLVKDAQQLAHEAGSAAGQKAGEIRAKGSALLDRAATSAQRAQETAIETSKGIATSADQVVRENAWTAVVVSGAIGMLLGYLIVRG